MASSITAADAPLPHLLHEVPAHALLLHPLEDVLGRPVAPQAHLHEVAPEHRPALDEPPHRRAVGGEVAVDDVGGVGVGVEVDDADVAAAVVVGDGRGRRPGDRVVAAEDHGDDAPAGHLADPGPDVGVARLGLPVGAVGVAVVDDLQPVEDLDAEVEVVGARARRPGLRRARGPKRAPGRFVVEMSKGAPTMATSGCQASSCSGSVRNGRWPNVARPAKFGRVELGLQPGREVAVEVPQAPVSSPSSSPVVVEAHGLARRRRRRRPRRRRATARRSSSSSSSQGRTPSIG